MKEMILVEGEVIYKVKVTTLIDKETALDEDKVNELLEHIGNGDLEWFAESSVKCDNKIPVLIDEKISEKYIRNSISSDQCKEILERDKVLKSKE